MPAALRLKNFRVNRGEFSLGPVDLEIEPGMALSLVGLNGAGKTTLLLGILGLVGRTEGTVEIQGEKVLPAATGWKKTVGIALDGQSHFERLTVRENLNVHAGLRASWDCKFEAFLLERLDLRPNSRVGDLSRGGRQKMALVTALAHRPKLIILDEATSGLDPVVRTAILDILVDQLRQNEASIIMATQVLADVGALSDQIAILQRGELTEIAAKDDLLDDWGRISFCLRVPLPKWTDIVEHKQDGELHLLTTRKAKVVLSDLSNLGATNIETSRVGLEEIATHILKG